MNKRISIKISDREIFFFSELFLYCCYSMLANTIWYYEIPNVISLIRNICKYAILLLIIFQMSYTEKFTIQTMLYYVAIGCLVVIIWLTGGYSGLFLQFGIILCASKIEYRKIVDFLFKNVLAWALIIHCLCFLGVLSDYTYVHKLGNTIMLAHSWGFLSYNHLGFMAMALTTMWLYLKKRNYVEILIVALLNYLYYRIHTTTLALVIAESVLLLYIMVCKWNWIWPGKKIRLFIASIYSVLLCGSVVLLVYLYATNRFAITLSFMNTIRNRISYSIYFFQKYGVHLFGQNIEMHSIQERFYNGAADNLYIDSGYIYSLIAYGILFTILILIMYTIVFRYIAKNNDKYLFIWLIVILTATVVNNFLVNIVFNPILFLFPAAIKGRNARFRKYKKARKKDKNWKSLM